MTPRRVIDRRGICPWCGQTFLTTGKAVRHLAECPKRVHAAVKR